MGVSVGVGKANRQISSFDHPHPGVALPFRDLRQPKRNIAYFASMARKKRTVKPRINAHYKAKMMK